MLIDGRPGVAKDVKRAFELAAAGAIVDKVVAKDKNLYDKIKANGSGLAFETQVLEAQSMRVMLSKRQVLWTSHYAPC